jgi:hypothetical protein
LDTRKLWDHHSLVRTIAQDDERWTRAIASQLRRNVARAQTAGTTLAERDKNYRPPRLRADKAKEPSVGLKGKGFLILEAQRRNYPNRLVLTAETAFNDDGFAEALVAVPEIGNKQQSPMAWSHSVGRRAPPRF